MKLSNMPIKNQDIPDNKLVEIPSRRKNFGLSKTEFDTLSEALKNGEELLFERIFLSHFQECEFYIMKKYSISKSVAYDLTMDTLIEFRRLIILDKVKYGNLRFLFTKMASQNLMRSQKKKAKTDLKPFFEVESFEVEDYEDNEHLYCALTLAWDVLDNDAKKILEAHFYNKTPLVKIAKVLGISDSSIRKKKQRGLEKLRTIFLKELKSK